MLAVALAERCLDRVQRVITLASNLSFVARPGWPDAMAPAVNRRFNGSFQADPALAWRRFTGLMAQGDSAERDLLKRLRQAFKGPAAKDRKSTRLNSSHVAISYAVLCLKNNN